MSRLEVLVAGIITVAYAIAAFFPFSPAWGVNALAFLSPTQLLILGLLFVASHVSAVSGWLLTSVDRMFGPNVSSSARLLGNASLLGVAFAAIAYYLRIRTDLYGDTITLLHHFAQHEYDYTDLWSLKDTEPLTRIIHLAVSDLFKIEIRSAYEIVSSAAGGVFCLVLLTLNPITRGDRTLRALFLIVGLTLGANQLFFGHVENYTLVYLCGFIFLLTAWRMFEGESAFGWLVICFVIGLRLHLLTVTLLPALLYAGWYSWKSRQGSAQAIPARLLLGWVGGSIISLFAVYYFYFDAFSISTDNHDVLMEKVFLPVVNPMENLNYYSLFSAAHLNDIFQLLLYISSPALLYVGVMCVLNHRYMAWKRPKNQFYLLATIYPILFAATVHAVLSVPRDWDLFALAGAPVFFLVFSVVDASRQQGRGNSRWASFNWATALSVLSAGIFLVNGSSESASERARSVGTWVYKSYHRYSSFLINLGSLQISDLEKQIAVRLEIQRAISPPRMKGDNEYSFLEQKLAETYYHNRNFSESEQSYRRALQVDSTNTEATKGLSVLYLKMRRYDEGRKLIDYYNWNYNDPEIQDHKMLLAAGYAHSLMILEELGADSVEIQGLLDSFEIVPPRRSN